MLTTETSRDAGDHFGQTAGGPLDVVLHEPANWALFLDIDGTLIDLAATPEGITVPADLPDHLAALCAKLDGALALVTGRALPFADALFSPLTLPIAGLHGAERRRADGTLDLVEEDDAFQTLKRSLARVTADWEGVIIEDKGAAVAAHYRQAPEWQQSLEAVMASALEEAGAAYALQHGKMVIEIRPARASKGAAVTAFLEEAPFRGRKPIAVGDDLTDEAMFKVANQCGGLSIRIGEPNGETAAQFHLDSASTLRKILKQISAA